MIDFQYQSLFWALEHPQKSILPTLFVCWCPAGGAPGDEGSVCGSDQREHWWGGSEGADDLGAAQGARSAAGQSPPPTTHPKATPANVDYIRNHTSVKSKALRCSVTLCICACSTDQRYEGAFGLLVWRREEHGHAGGAAGPWHPDLNQFNSSSQRQSSASTANFLLFFIGCWLFCYYKPVNYIKLLCAVTLEIFLRSVTVDFAF